MLPDNHYLAHDIECNICGAAEESEEADSPEDVDQTSVSSTAVIQTKACTSPHVFEKLCLYTWLDSNLRRDQDATCPMCCHKLILSKIPLKFDQLLREFQECIAQTNAFIDGHIALIVETEKLSKAVEDLLTQLPGDEKLLSRLSELRGEKEESKSRIEAAVMDKVEYETYLEETKRRIEERA